MLVLGAFFLIFQNCPQRFQNRYHVFFCGTCAHQADAPDFSFERAEAGADFDVVIG